MIYDEALLEQLRSTYPKAEQWWQQAQANQQVFEEYLYRNGLVSNTELLNAKSKATHFPKAILPDNIPNEILTLIPETTARNHQLLAYTRTGERLSLGAVDPQHHSIEEVIGFLRNTQHLEASVSVITLEDFNKAFRLYRGFPAELKRLVSDFRKGKPLATQNETLFTPGTGDDAPVAQLVALIVQEAVLAGASDVHFEPLASRMKVRFRLQGELKTITYLPKDLHNQISNRIKILSRLKLDETRAPQDGRIRATIDGREIDFRIGILPTVEGEKVTIRILDPRVGLKKVGELGLAPYHQAVVEQATAKPYGLILITGPTGSGKTTTLYALLQSFNHDDVNIVSLEDPVEYRIEGINQSQVMPEIAYTFSTGLREILRQDPDIILVGEIRDRETADLAIHSALTGHLVLSTLHTNDALGSINRLTDLGIERFLLAPTIQVLVAQRLVRQLCDCKEAVHPSAALQAIIAETIQTLPEIARKTIPSSSDYTIYRPKGCPRCHQRGFQGRIALFEVAAISEAMRQAIEVGKAETELRSHLAEQGFISLRQDGVLKALQGLVTLEEVIKITS